ncbi:MAG: HNH endonuclease [Planctomycetia bacterium]|nr:HNH endonuclease [Planctomycetia bacterium]
MNQSTASTLPSTTGEQPIGHAWEIALQYLRKHNAKHEASDLFSPALLAVISYLEATNSFADPIPFGVFESQFKKQERLNSEQHSRALLPYYYLSKPRRANILKLTHNGSPVTYKKMVDPRNADWAPELRQSCARFNPDLLHALQNEDSRKAIKAELRRMLGEGKTDGDGNNSEQTYSEGKVRLRLHRRKERNRTVVRQRKQQVLKTQQGKLLCEVCDFDFVALYGEELGYGFAECHHRVPLAQLTEEHRITPDELAIVCANCHRILHRRLNLTVEKLRGIVQCRRAQQR